MICKICGVNKTDNPDMISEWEGWDAPLAGSSPGSFVELMRDGFFGLYM